MKSLEMQNRKKIFAQASSKHLIHFTAPSFFGFSVVKCVTGKAREFKERKHWLFLTSSLCNYFADQTFFFLPSKKPHHPFKGPFVRSIHPHAIKSWRQLSCYLLYLCRLATVMDMDEIEKDGLSPKVCLIQSKKWQRIDVLSDWWIFVYRFWI